MFGFLWGIIPRDHGTVEANSTNPAGNSTNQPEPRGTRFRASEQSFDAGANLIQQCPAVNGIARRRKPPHPWILKAASFWRLNLLAWITLALVFFSVRWILHQDLVHALFFTIAGESSAFLLTLVLRSVYRRVSITFDLRTAILTAIFSLLASVLLAGIAHSLTLFTGWYNPHFTPLEDAVLRVLLMWAIFLGWSFGYFWLRAEIDLRSETLLAEEAVREAHRMELQMLRAQLDPHFLFNSLNGIATEIHSHPDSATEMVRELSDYLRYSLDHRKRAIGPLSDELDAMKAYLEIEKARFGERLSVRFETTNEARCRNVPSFLLQPLVENAIKHGLSASRHPMELSLMARVDGDMLTIEVDNTGALDEPDPSRDGIGLDTLRRRLELNYPRRHKFTLAADQGLVRAKLQLRGDPCSA